MYHRTTLIGWGFLLLALFGSLPASAQQAGLQIQVLAQDGGAPVVGAQVTLLNPGTGLVRAARTDAFGQVRIEGLATGGGYSITVDAGAAHGGAVAESISLRANFVQSVSLAVGPVDIPEIVIAGNRISAGLNSVNAEISATLSADVLEALPIEGRDVITSLIRLPNVVPSTGFFPEAPVVSINGANGLFTNYLMDGLDNNENFLGGLKFPVPLGFTQDVTVLANSYSVAYGRSANGVVNYTTPSGGNDLHGEIYTLVRPGRQLWGAPFEVVHPEV